MLRYRCLLKVASPQHFVDIAKDKCIKFNAYKKAHQFTIPLIHIFSSFVYHT